jgi:hypothetical protein
MVLFFSLEHELVLQEDFDISVNIPSKTKAQEPSSKNRADLALCL